AGDEIALRTNERHDLRTHADARRRDRRRVLDLPADAEQVRVVPGQSEHEPRAVRRAGHEEVAVGDPAGKRREPKLPAGKLGQATERARELVTKRAPQLLLSGLRHHGRAAAYV